MVWSYSKIDEVRSEKLREKVKGRDGGRKKKEKELCVQEGGGGLASMQLYSSYFFSFFSFS